MTAAYEQGDAIGFYFSGGESNYDPDASLGGVMSNFECISMTARIITPVQGIVIDQVSPSNGFGSASIEISGNAARFTSPSGGTGEYVNVYQADMVYLPSADVNQGIRIFRQPGQTFKGIMEMELVEALNGVLAMQNIEDAERQAGSERYRALFVKNHSSGALSDLAFSVGVDGAASYELALETPAGGAVQTIADDTTAPVGLSFLSSVSISALAVGEAVALWLKRIFPADGDAAKNQVTLSYQYTDMEE